ncbi:MAG: hypothetical protein M1817_002835 [Caeruleum heppii]|nr:MAG: hypothetical protein M1817_002835 [Caeruleum heppii]
MSGLFGNLGGTSSAQNPGQQQTGSLFGNLNTGSTSSQPASSMFSTLGGASTTSSLFGNPSQAQQHSTAAPSGTLFGASSSQQPSNSLFSSTNTTTQPQQASSLFGKTTTQPQQSSLFGGGQPQNNQPNQTQQPQQGSHSAPSPLKPSQPAYFDSLLERSRKRQHGTEGDAEMDDLPSLQLGLGDISQRARALGGAAGTPKRGKPMDSRAHYLLAASGITPGAALRDLNTLNPPSAVAVPQPPSTDTDTAAYVSNLQTQSTLALIEEGLNRSVRDFDRFLEENVTIDWEVQRRKIYEHFNLMPKGGDRPGGDSTTFSPVRDSSSFGKSTRRGRGRNTGIGQSTGAAGSVASGSTLQKSVIGTPGRAGSSQATLFADVAEKSSAAGVNATDDRVGRDKQAKYAGKINALNTSRVQGMAFPVLHEFADVESQVIGDSSSKWLLDAYKALCEIIQEDPSAVMRSDPKAVKERQFAADYLDETPNSAKLLKLRQRILEGSRRCLEKSFYKNLESVVDKNPREARQGGVPTTINRVRAYVNLRSSRRDLAPDNVDLQSLGDEYCWVIIFYLLRSGHAKEAAQYVKENGTAFRTIDRNFPTYITNYIKNKDRRLDRALQDRINAEYSQRLRIAPENSIDPYRMACYKVIGRCDLSKRHLDVVGQGVEDWIWLQFHLAREVNRVEEVAGEVYGLEDVRNTIREIGQRHFAKDSGEAFGGFGTFFYLQILGGMFEQAVSYLYSFSYVSAVHFAIALDFYGLLRVSDFTASESELRKWLVFLRFYFADKDEVTMNTKRMPQINFGRMIGYYTRDFRAANVDAATDYLTLIGLNADLPGEAGRSQSALCHEALRELVLETREFAKLLGDIRSDGQRIPGAIESRLKLIKVEDPNEFLRTITVQAASVADDNGRTTDAVLLYHLAEEYDNVITIINRALSEAIAVDIGQDQMRLEPLKPREPQQPPPPGGPPDKSSLSLTSVDDPAELARNMISLYNSNALYFSKIKQTNRDACGVLLRMSEAKHKVETGQWAEALDIIDSLSILPLRASGQISQIRAHANTFPSLPAPIARNVGNLLMWTITCCGRQRDVLRQSAFADATKAEMKRELKFKARDLMVFAGLMRLRLSGRVYEAIARAGGEVEEW